MIIDCHCHAGKGDGLTQPADTAAPLDKYLQRARAAGIDRTVIFPTFSDGYLQANRAVAGIVARDPRRLLGFAAPLSIFTIAIGPKILHAKSVHQKTRLV